MKATLLGTSSTVGMPAPLCDCTYCAEITRTRPSLLIETDSVTLLFDASPDVNEQLSDVEVTNIDAVFVTHHHHDHSTGLKELNHNTGTKREYIHRPNTVPSENDDWYDTALPIYCSHRTGRFLKNDMGYIFQSNNVTQHTLDEGTPIQMGDVTVTPIRVDHCDGYFGFEISDDTETIVYIPDYGPIRSDHTFTDVDYFVFDGSSFLGYDIHGDGSGFTPAKERVGAEKTILVNVSEHISQVDTAELETRADEAGTILGVERMVLQ